MALDIYGIAFSLVILFLYLVILFLLLNLRIKLTEQFSGTIICFRVSVIILIILRIQTVLVKADLIKVPYLQEILALALAIILLCAFYKFHKVISSVSKTKRRRYF